MENILRKITLVSAMGTLIAMGGCASIEDVKRAQSTADQALSAAQQAQQGAASAQSAAQAAQQSADRANAGVNALEQKVQGIQQDIDTYKEQRRRGQRG